MGKKITQTKESLLIVAGKLFAKKGFEQVSTREIAQKADVNLGCIHYHFGSKENLYMDCHRFVMSEWGLHDKYNELMDELFDEIDKPDKAIELVKKIVHANFKALFYEKKHSKWKQQLILQELVSPTVSHIELVNDLFLPFHDNLRKIYKKVLKNDNDEDADIWAFQLAGQIAFLLQGEHGICTIMKRDELSHSFYEKTYCSIARNMIRDLGLSVPNDLIVKKQMKKGE